MQLEYCVLLLCALVFLVGGVILFFLTKRRKKQYELLARSRRTRDPVKLRNLLAEAEGFHYSKICRISLLHRVLMESKTPMEIIAVAEHEHASEELCEMALSELYRREDDLHPSEAELLRAYRLARTEGYKHASEELLLCLRKIRPDFSG